MKVEVKSLGGENRESQRGKAKNKNRKNMEYFGVKNERSEDGRKWWKEREKRKEGSSEEGNSQYHPIKSRKKKTTREAEI